MREIDRTHKAKDLLLHNYGGAEIEERAAKIIGCEDRDLEDKMLDVSVERCNRCGYWIESCEVNQQVLEKRGETVCSQCEEERDEEE
jgi:hypothetical protein